MIYISISFVFVFPQYFLLENRTAGNGAPRSLSGSILID